MHKKAVYALENNLPCLEQYDQNFANDYWKYDWHFLTIQSLDKLYEGNPSYLAALWAGAHAYAELEGEVEAGICSLIDKGYSRDEATTLVYDIHWEMLGFEIDRCAQTMQDIFATKKGWESKKLLDKHTDALTELDELKFKIRGKVEKTCSL